MAGDQGLVGERGLVELRRWGLVTSLASLRLVFFKPDFERPFKAVWQTFMVDLSTPRPGERPAKVRVHPSVRVRENRFSAGSKRRRRRDRRTGGDGTDPSTTAPPAEHPTEQAANVGAV